MWIENTADSRRHYNDDILGDIVDDPVDDLPGDERGIVWDGPIQVTNDVGEVLCEHYDSIRPYEAGGNDS
jgi:hypothetical protein